MAIEVMVVSNLGKVHGRVSGTEINELCRRANGAGLPMLGYVDEYDDTYFNRSQMRLLIPELEQLARSAPPAEANMATQLLELARRVSTHDQMIFAGD
ncbi:MAG TPA: hypothetical protein VHN18_08310 [Micromonosporaceae bacterium]|nr:hypothetical protein [Micromonosporaceae bacterium]